jgi:hypothetical protein
MNKRLLMLNPGPHEVEVLSDMGTSGVYVKTLYVTAAAIDAFGGRLLPNFEVGDKVCIEDGELFADNDYSYYFAGVNPRRRDLCIVVDEFGTPVCTELKYLAEKE